VSEVATAPAGPMVFTEGRIAIPPGYREQTTNLLLPANPQRDPSLNIARDRLQPGETLDAYVDRQLALLEAQLSGYRLLARGAARLGRPPHACEGRGIATSYRHGKTVVHQRQAAFLLDPQHALIFTASAGRPFLVEEEPWWADWLASYQLPPPADAGPEIAAASNAGPAGAGSADGAPAAAAPAGPAPPAPA
jgi:hypothetical protein